MSPKSVVPTFVHPILGLVWTNWSRTGGSAASGGRGEMGGGLEQQPKRPLIFFRLPPHAFVW